MLFALSGVTGKFKILASTKKCYRRHKERKIAGIRSQLVFLLLYYKSLLVDVLVKGKVTNFLLCAYFAFLKITVEFEEVSMLNDKR